MSPDPQDEVELGGMVHIASTFVRDGLEDMNSALAWVVRLVESRPHMVWTKIEIEAEEIDYNGDGRWSATVEAFDPTLEAELGR